MVKRTREGGKVISREGKGKRTAPAPPYDKQTRRGGQAVNGGWGKKGGKSRTRKNKTVFLVLKKGEHKRCGKVP